MARRTFNSKGKKVKAHTVGDKGGSSRSAEDVVRELKQAMQKPSGEDYRERSLAIHGLVCARCGREFDHSNRHLLTVHHKDHNHHYNPPDGSNWENLCVYCHEDAHSREILGEYFEGTADKGGDEVACGSGNHNEGTGFGILGEKLQQALHKKKQL